MADRSKTLGRAYIHDACSSSTVVKGNDYVELCNALLPCGGTYCCSCKSHFPLDNFAWEDTGEKLSDYRERIRSECPAMQRLPFRLLGAVVGLAIGGGLGFVLMGPLGAAIGAVALVAGFATLAQIPAEGWGKHHYQID